MRVDIVDQTSTDRMVDEVVGKDTSARFNFVMDRAEEADELDV